MHILYLTHHSWPFPNRVMAFSFGICLAAKSAADRTWYIQQSWSLREHNKAKWLGKAHRGNKGTKLFTLEETTATSQKQIWDHVPVTNYFKCHPFIIPSSHRQPVFQNLQIHARDTAPPAVKVKLSAFPVHILLSNGSSTFRDCAQQLLSSINLLSSKDAHCSFSGQNVCGEIYAVSSQYPGLSNIVSDYFLFLFVAFSCHATFRGLITAWFLSLVIVFLFPFSKANYKDFPDITFLFW